MRGLLACLAVACASGVLAAPALAVEAPTVAITGSPEHVQVTGTAQPGATVTLYDRSELADTVLAATTADGAGAYTIDVAIGPHRSYTLVVTQTVAGVESAHLAALGGTITVAPKAPTLVVAGPTTVTAGTTLVLLGVGYPGATLTVRDQGTTVATTTVAADGTWTTTYDAPAGARSLDARQTVILPGALSAAASVSSLGAPVIVYPTPGIKFGPLFQIIGTNVVSGALVTVKDEDGTTLGTATAASGALNITTTVPISIGAHSVAITQTLSGVTGATTHHTVTHSPNRPTVTSPTSGSTQPGGVRATGTGLPNAAITVRLADGTVIGTATAGSDGAFDFLAPYAPGAASVLVTQTINGVESAWETDPPVPVTVTVPPPTLVLSAATVAAGGVVGLSGTAPAGATITITDDLVPAAATTAGLNGAWAVDYTVPAASTGAHTIRATQAIAPFATSVAASAPLTVVGAPGVNTPIADARVGSSFTVSGTGVVGATLSVGDGAGHVLATGTIGSSASWSVTASAPSAVASTYGPKTLTVAQTLNGVTGPATTRAVSVAPGTPTMTIAPVTGGARFTGTAVAGATVSIFNSGHTTLASAVAAADGAFDFTATLPGGFYQVRYTQTVNGIESFNPAANVTVTAEAPTLVLTGASTVAAGTPLALSGVARPGATVEVRGNGSTLMATATAGQDGAWAATPTAVSGAMTLTASQYEDPQVPSLASAGIAVDGIAAPNWPIASGQTVTPLFATSGNSRANATIRIFDASGTTLGTTTATAGGAWSLTTTTPLGVGVSNVSVTQTVGGVTSLATTKPVQVVPNPPTLTSPVFPTSPMGGGIHVAGTGGVGATITLRNAGGVLGTGTADGTGAFDFTVPLAPGSYLVFATQTMPGGNASAATSSVSVTVMPGAPTLVLTDGATVRAGVPVTVGGVSLPGAQIDLRENAQFAAQVSAGGDGVWSATFTLSGGRHDMTATQTVTGGFVSAEAHADLVALGTPNVVFPVAGARVTPPFDLIGNAAYPGATVTVKDGGGATVATTTAASDGGWTATIASATFGVQDLAVTQTVAGVTSAAALFGAEVAAVAPVVDLAGPHVGALRVRGTGRPNASIKLYQGLSATPLGSGTADGDGDFDFEVALLPGQYAPRVSQTVNGAESARSAEQAVWVVGAAPTMALTGPDTVPAGTIVEVSGTALPGATVTVSNIASIPRATATADAGGEWSTTWEASGQSDELTARQTNNGVLGVPSQPLTLNGVAPPDAQWIAGARVLRTFTVSGSGGWPGATITARDGDGDSLGTTTASGGGQWSLTTTAALDFGPEDVTLEQTYQAITSPRATKQVTVIPAAPLVTGPVWGSPAYGPLHLRGSGWPGATVRAYRFGDSAVQATGTVGDDGLFDVLVPVTMGSSLLRVSQTMDSAPSDTSGWHNVYVLPGAPTLAVSGGATVPHGTTVAIHGTAMPGGVVRVFEPGHVLVASATPGSGGAWEASFVSDGSRRYTLTAEQTLDGLSGDVSAELVVRSVGAPVVTTPGADRTVGATFDMLGGGIVGALITVTDGSGHTLGTTTVPSQGPWTLTTAPMAPGRRVLEVRQTFNGVTGPIATRQVLYPPGQPVLSGPAPGSRVAAAVRLRGTAVAGATVDVYDGAGATALKTGTVGSDGAFDISVSLAPGDYQLRLAQTVFGGLAGPRTPALAIEAVPAAPTLARGAAAVPGGARGSVSGTALPGATITVRRNGIAIAGPTAAGDGGWSASFDVEPGDNLVSARQTSAAKVSDYSEPVHILSVGAPTLTLREGATVVGPSIRLEGDALPGAVVAAVDGDGVRLGSVTVPASGGWSMTAGELGGGARQLAVAQTAEGVTGPAVRRSITVQLPPVVTLEPEDRTAAVGETARFAASASGTPAPGVRWQSSGDGGATWTDVPGATAASYERKVVASDDGLALRAVFGNAVGSVTTRSAILHVASVAIASRPAALAVGLRASRSSARRGQKVVYTSTTRNAGKAAATSARLCVTPPATVTVTDRGGGDLAAGKLCWRLARVAAGKAVTRTFTVRVKARAKRGRTVSRATVAWAGRSASATHTLRIR